jgi:multidrug efflux pump
MIGVTIFGLILTPLFYYTLAKRRDRQLAQGSSAVTATEDTHHA